MSEILAKMRTLSHVSDDNRFFQYGSGRLKERDVPKRPLMLTLRKNVKRIERKFRPGNVTCNNRICNLKFVKSNNRRLDSY